MQRVADLISRFRRDERGAFLVLFAVLALVLIATSGAVVDFSATQTARSRAQTALDSAALALQTRISIDNNATIVSKAQTLLQQRLNDASITATVNSATIDTNSGKLNLQATIVVPTAFVQLVGIKNITAHLQSEVTRGSTNLEVSVALDTTGSMGTPGSKITDLISATNTLIDLVVQDVQTPTYTKMAIVPWSASVNVGSTYAANVRGAITGGTSITGASWAVGAAVRIKSITQAKPGVVTTQTTHGFSNGDYVYITGVGGMDDVNDTIYKVTNANAANKTFELYTTSGSKVKTTRYDAATSNTGTVTKCQISTCDVVVTSTSHGLAAGDNVYITGVKGMTGINDSSAASPSTVETVVNTNSFSLDNEFGPDQATYTNSGTAYCVKYGCQYFYFQTAQSGTHYAAYQPNNCVTERSTHAFDDTAPSTTALGINYTANGSDCVSKAIQPLTTDKVKLHALANSLSAADSTAGHLGLAWGWYMVSPNFAYLWPAASQPAAYKTKNLIKAVVLMTDGAFNIAYCKGVLSDNSQGNDTSQINCDATDGTSSVQAPSVCDAIKADANGIILYTVGFDIASDTTAQTLLRNCATDSDHYFQADTGTDLKTAFKQIAENLSELRLSK